MNMVGKYSAGVKKSDVQSERLIIFFLFFHVYNITEKVAVMYPYRNYIFVSASYVYMQV